MTDAGEVSTGRRGLSLVDLATGVVLILVGIAVFVLTLDFRPATSAGRDPSILPRAAAVVLALCGLGVGAGGLRGRRQPDSSEAPALATITAGQERLDAYAREEQQQPEAAAGGATTGAATAAVVEEPPRLGPVVALVAGVAVYGWLAFTVGYVVVTALFLVAAPVLLAGRRDRRTVLIVALFAAGLTTLMYAGFVEFLRVPLPSTPLP